MSGVRKIVSAEDTPEKLLAEWFRWWRTNDDGPAKLPEGLHVRTAVWLTMHPGAELELPLEGEA